MDEVRVEYAAVLLVLVSVEASDPAHAKRLDQRLKRLRNKLTPEDIAQAEQVVNRVDRNAKAILAGRT